MAYARVVRLCTAGVSADDVCGEVWKEGSVRCSTVKTAAGVKVGLVVSSRRRCWSFRSPPPTSVLA